MGADADIPEVGAFLGDGRSWSVPQVIPGGTLAVVALLEHRWVMPLRDAVARAGGKTLADAWIDPDDPIAQAAAVHEVETKTRARS